MPIQQFNLRFNLDTWGITKKNKLMVKLLFLNIFILYKQLTFFFNQ